MNSLTSPQEWTAAELIPVAACVVIVAFVMIIWASVVERDPLKARVRAMSAHRDQLRNRAQKASKEARRRPYQKRGMFSRIASQMRQARTAQMDQARAVLAQAGWRSNEALGIYVTARAAAPLVMVCGAYVAFYLLPWGQDQSDFFRFLGLLVFTLAGYALPDMILGQIARHRRVKIERALPDALDLLVVCAEAGLGLDAAFDRVSTEIATSHPQLADELTVTSVELNILPDRSEALNNLVKRTNVASVDSVISTLNQTERYGTPLAQSFRILANDFRDQRMLRAEEKAARLPAILTVPMVMFILPCLFIVLLGPAIIKTLNTFN